MLKEITDLAGQRERVAETFEEQIIHGILILAKNLKDDRKVGYFYYMFMKNTIIFLSTFRNV